MPPIVFASESFLKKVVFERARLDHTIDPAVIDESQYVKLGIEERTRRMASAKCQQVVGRHEGSMSSRPKLSQPAMVHCYGVR